MPSITDPMNALLGLQEALGDPTVNLRPCELHPELQVILDHPNGKPRITYARIRGDQVEAIAIFALAEPVQGIPCFGLGYAVIEPLRHRGLASATVRAALEELTHGLRRAGRLPFYVDAVVARTNLASNKLAMRLISESPEAGTDALSGEPIFQYLKRIE
jgi:hypothetical protein